MSSFLVVPSIYEHSTIDEQIRHLVKACNNPPQFNGMIMEYRTQNTTFCKPKNGMQWRGIYFTPVIRQDASDYDRTSTVVMNSRAVAPSQNVTSSSLVRNKNSSILSTSIHPSDSSYQHINDTDNNNNNNNRDILK